LARLFEFVVQPNHLFDSQRGVQGGLQANPGQGRLLRGQVGRSLPRGLSVLRVSKELSSVRKKSTCQKKETEAETFLFTENSMVENLFKQRNGDADFLSIEEFSR